MSRASGFGCRVACGPKEGSFVARVCAPKYVPQEWEGEGGVGVLL